MIIATRNRLIHAYLGIDDDTIWSIIRMTYPAAYRAQEDHRKGFRLLAQRSSPVCRGRQAGGFNRLGG